jgi:hypothetical protein
MWVCQKSHVALILLMFGKNYPNYKKLEKTKKNLSQTLKLVSKFDKVFFPMKKKCNSQKNYNFFLWEKGICEEKSSFIFLRVLTHNFERIHHETNWSDFRLGGLFYFILFLIWLHPLKILLIFNSLYIYVYFTLSPPCRSKQTMTRWMDDRMDVKHHFIHLSSHCRALACVPSLLIAFSTTLLYIPLFLCLLEVNRPWRDGWMTKWMDEMMFHESMSFKPFSHEDPFSVNPLIRRFLHSTTTEAQKNNQANP